MRIVYSLLFGIGMVLCASALSSCVILFSDYKYYKMIYNRLPTYTFYKFHNQVWNGENGGDFTWFIDDNTFCIAPGHYLHDALYTWINPYSAYWLIKYRRWFKKNCKPIILDFKNN